MSIWTSLIAVIGTLGGAVTASLLQQRAARADRCEQRARELRQQRLEAVTGLSAALADHRRAMWLREQARLEGADWTAARAASHETRAAITAPMTTLMLLAPSLTGAARTAAEATYALRDADTPAALEAGRTAAIDAADDLLKKASNLL
ncbi:protein kilB [Streptomyces sp. WMMC897]|uniref:protein kilB n=1 Tax=Streptomyces sp. WMMC897 TaxID=3014782 RepID=UPI0022B6DF09|nr:protein kilB [Streptomyces sp. WMMC897]MCZ7417565.1 protein kilB [Streptomyces sp. WMMC897]